jgi:hypothetical protein
MLEANRRPGLNSQNAQLWSQFATGKQIMWVYVARGGRAGKKNALPREIYAPHSNGGDKTHDDWPANTILG